ncbi:MAG: hypothetical protein LBD23_14640, partial [Oscillospiraceae bacterium]|nr:hypothetical protein [Oscillospiraceae bacterium]
MKKTLSIVLALFMLMFALAACADPAPEPPPVDPPASDDPSPEPPPPPPPDDPPVDIPDVFLWDNFEGRDPMNKPDNSPNGAPMWWDNWANMRASVDNDIVQIQFRPSAFDPEDFDDYSDYYARAMDWMGNWGEAIDMWSLDGISWCKYLTIRMAGVDGGEESGLLLHFQPEDGPVFIKRFTDLVTQDGGSPQITTDMQDIVIDLEASGFPGMTNRMHIRSFAAYTIFLDEIYFSDPISPVDSESVETILGGINVPESPFSNIPIESLVNFRWNDYVGRDP